MTLQTSYVHLPDLKVKHKQCVLFQNESIICLVYSNWQIKTSKTVTENTNNITNKSQRNCLILC